MCGGSLRALAVIAAALTLLTACSSGDFWERASDGRWGKAPGQEGGLDPSLRMSAVSASVREGQFRLEWQPVQGIDRYRVDDGAAQMDVPAAICRQTCTLGLPPRNGGRQQLAVSAVTADGDFSKASSAAVQAPEPAGEEPARPLDEVVVIRQDPMPDDPENNPPTVERVPVASAAEARREIEQTWGDREVISVSVNHPVKTAQGGESSSDTIPKSVVWQRDAMEFDRLPGNPRGDGVTVALVESGAPDATHPSLKGAVEAGTVIGGDGSGKVEPGVHATATSSLIVGQLAVGVPGVAPGATLLPVSLGGDEPDAADLAEGIIWAVDHGADVINVSAGTDCTDRVLSGCPDSLEAAARYAEENGVVMVAAAGNNGPGPNCTDEPADINVPWTPAVVDSVISVGAYGPDGKRWECSSIRGDVDVLAPGVRLMHAWPGGGYGINDGTSFSAPLVSGLIATLLAERPDLEPAEIRELLPQWQLADGRLSIYAVLVSLGIVEIDDSQPPPVTDMDLRAIYPFEAFIGVGPKHPMRTELEATKDLQSGADPTNRIYASVSSPWWTGGFAMYKDEPWGYGAIGGQIYLHKDGSVTASGRLNFSRLAVGSHRSRDMTGWHRMVCHSRLPVPASKVFRWETPVKVGVKAFTGGDENTPARARLTFSLGAGATTSKHGQLPPMTLKNDNLADCPAQMEASEGLDPVQIGTAEQQQAAFDEYARRIERIERMLVEATPLTTAEAVPLNGEGDAAETRAAQDPNMHLRIDVN